MRPQSTGTGRAATLDGQITLGLFTFYTATLNQFSSSLNNLFRSLSHHYEDALYLVDLFRFLDLPNTIEPGATRLDNGKRPPLIVFKNVDFAYPNTERLVLKDFNLVIEPGERVALVGHAAGGALALAYAQARPGRVRALALGDLLLVEGATPPTATPAAAGRRRARRVETWYSGVAARLPLIRVKKCCPSSSSLTGITLRSSPNPRVA